MSSYIHQTSLILTCMLAYFAASCGHQADDNAQFGDKTATDQQKKVDSPKDTSIYTYSQLINNDSELPKCDESHERQLVYVLENKEFKACSKGLWVVVDIAGKDGKDGINGINGVDGKNGINGTNGKDGVNGINGKDGKDGQTVTSTMFYDAVTKKYWMLGMAVATFKRNDICINGWRLPTSTELYFAIQHGLGAAAQQVGAVKYTYTSTFSYGSLVYGNGPDSTAFDPTAHYCIQE